MIKRKFHKKMLFIESFTMFVLQNLSVFGCKPEENEEIALSDEQSHAISFL
jgi:hypothetical protein